MSVSELAERIFEKQANGPIVVMGIGLPGAGKTEVLKPLSEEFDPIALYLSRKAVQNMVLRDQPDAYQLPSTSFNRKTWTRLYSNAGEYLRAGGSVIVDATHTSEKRRQLSVIQYHQRGAVAVIGAYFSISHPSMALERLQISMHGNSFTSMVEDLKRKPPSLSEGFSDIIRISSDELPPSLI